MIDSILLATSSISNGISVFKPLYWAFGKVMEVFLQLFDGRYFIALLLFTFLTRVILFPLNLRQQRTMAKTSRLQPKIQKIQKKYQNSNDPRDRQRMNEEMQELYAREGHNPMNMGCGPMAFQMVFLMGIIGIIYYPLQYVIGISELDDSTIREAIAAATSFDRKTDRYFQLFLLQHIDDLKPILLEKFPKVFNESNITDIIKFKKSLTLFGLDMSQIPNWKDWKNGIIVVPILTLLSQMGTSVLSTIIQKKQKTAPAGQGSQMMMMMLMMPLFSFWFSFQVPAAVAVYWIISSLIAILQQLITAKYFPPKRNMARSMIDSTIERRSREENIKKVQNS